MVISALLIELVNITVDIYSYDLFKSQSALSYALILYLILLQFSSVSIISLLHQVSVSNSNLDKFLLYIDFLMFFGELKNCQNTLL